MTENEFAEGGLLRQATEPEPRRQHLAAVVMMMNIIIIRLVIQSEAKNLVGNI